MDIRDIIKNPHTENGFIPQIKATYKGKEVLIFTTQDQKKGSYTISFTCLKKDGSRGRSFKGSAFDFENAKVTRAFKDGEWVYPNLELEKVAVKQSYNY